MRITFQRLSRSGILQQGSTILYLILALVVLGALAAGTTSMMSSTARGTARVNCEAQAVQFAESGMRYAMSQLRPLTDLSQAQTLATSLQNANPFTITDGANAPTTLGTFDLTNVSQPYQNGGAGPYFIDVTCQGGACPTMDQSTAQVTGTFNLDIATGGAGSPETINFDDISEFPGAGTGGTGADGFVNPNTDDNSLSMGNNAKASYGCAWYTGDKSPCTDGVCDFGSGFRAYYEVMLSYNAQGDGFVFAIVNADNNTIQDCGGDTGRGELLAYAGPGNSGHGLRSPKMGLEFDIYGNTGTGSVCNVSQRADDPASRDHLAWLFWGQNYWTGGCNETYDDNRHGAGVWTGTDGTPPNADMLTNPMNIGESGAGEDGYYYDEAHGGNWMRSYNSSNQSKKFRVRIEVDRSQTANPDGNYAYTLKGWIHRDNQAMPAGYDNVTQDYHVPANSSTDPQVIHTVVLSETKHQKLNQVIFGWTAATGGATKILTISDFELKFKDNATACAAEEKPQDYVAGLPFYEGKGGRVHNVANNTSAYFNYAHWLAGKSCSECGSLFFDNTYGPLTMWNDVGRTMTTEGTVSAWVYIKDYHNYAGILRRGGTDAKEVFSLQFTQNNFRHKSLRNNYMWRFNPDRTTGNCNNANSCQFRIDDGHKKPFFCINQGGSQAYCVNSQYELEQDRWYHLTATWDSNADLMQFFVNGQRTATFDSTVYGWDLPTPQNRWCEFIVGAQTKNGQYNFDGMIDEVYLYDRVLSNDEITDLYNDGLRIAQEQ